MVRGKVSREEWCEAALKVMGEGGVGSLSIERLASQLGVTKGSFYWHFKNRSALVDGALALWTQLAFEEVVEALDAVPDPRERLRMLFANSVRDFDELRMEAVLAGAIAHPQVAAVVAEVGARRLTYLESLYEACGVESPAVWARVAYASYLGAVQLAAVSPSPLDDVPKAAFPILLSQRLIPD